MSMRNLQDKRRREVLARLSKAGAMQGGHKEMMRAMGYRGGRRVASPDSQQPNLRSGPQPFARWAQSALRAILGIKLKIDGNIGPVTRAAIKRFQRLEGLSAHGYLDERTIQALELRTGVRAPRGVGHEAIPHLLLLPRKGLWKPPADKDKDKDKDKTGKAAKAGKGGKAQQAAVAEGEISPLAADAARAAEASADGPVHEGAALDEALGAVQAMAFDEPFARLAAERLGQEDWRQAQSEMNTWWQEHQQSDPESQPRWVGMVRAEARGLDQRAADRLRRRWWSAHVDGGER